MNIRNGTAEIRSGSMAETESINGRRTAMDEKDFELLRILDETRNITHAADKLY